MLLREAYALKSYYKSTYKSKSMYKSKEKRRDREVVRCSINTDEGVVRDVYAVGGSYGVFAVKLYENGSARWVEMYKGDDGFWSLLQSYDPYWLPAIQHALSLIRA